MDYKELYNGYKIPSVAYGTGVILRYSRKPTLFLKSLIKGFLSSVKNCNWNRRIVGDFFCKRILHNAYESGYRFYDTARIYGYSEKRIGEMKSKDTYVVTKISDMDLERKCTPDNVKGNFDLSLSYLKRDYTDGLLLHYPHGNWLGIYREIEELYVLKKTKCIGICNCGIKELEVIRDTGLLMPMILQIELHPLNSKKAIREYCNKNNIQIMAHTPTARMCTKIQKSELLNNIAKVHSRTIAQIILRWHYQNNIIPVLSTFNKNHMKENLNIFDFQLEQSEMDLIDLMDEQYTLLESEGIDDPNYIYNL